jgi:hypothetical protein
VDSQGCIFWANNVFEPGYAKCVLLGGKDTRMHKLPRTIITLDKRINTLGGLLRQCANERKLHRAAEKIREARIRVLRAKIGEMPSVRLTGQQRKQIAKFSLQIESLRTIPAAEIINEVRDCLFQ